MGSKASRGPFLIVDVNDVLTKAILIEMNEDRNRLEGTGEAATTVEFPYLDVTRGIKNAVTSLEALTGQRLKFRGSLDNAQIETGTEVEQFLCSTSSGGGLQMIVAGLVKIISSESAQRASLGAGALIVGVHSYDGGLQIYQKIQNMRSRSPDIFLLAGGTDGGAEMQVVEMANLIKTADIKPRFGEGYKLPIIFAGNVEIRNKIANILSKEKFALKMVENVRPTIDLENLGPAKEGIYDSFMEHIILHSPGYQKLLNWVDEPLIPTQAAIGNILYLYARERNINLIGVDVGGATTDVYSIYREIFNRSLNADYGMTYGVCNIMKEAGLKNIMRWLPTDIDEREVQNTISNVMINLSDWSSPNELLIQHAVTREAIRLGLEHHKTIASRLKGVARAGKRTVADLFYQKPEDTYLEKMIRFNTIVGKGKVLSSAPRMEQVALVLIDAIQPEGVTEVLLDRDGVTPHLGILSRSNKDAALEVLKNDCLISLGHCIAPMGTVKEGREVMTVTVSKDGGEETTESVSSGEMKRLRLAKGELVNLKILPAGKIDAGKGEGKKVEKRLISGVLGLILDGRGRPFTASFNKDNLLEWNKALGTYSELENMI